jgi:hypothetical protein
MWQLHGGRGLWRCRAAPTAAAAPAATPAPPPRPAASAPAAVRVWGLGAGQQALALGVGTKAGEALCQEGLREGNEALRAEAPPAASLKHNKLHA